MSLFFPILLAFLFILPCVLSLLGKNYPFETLKSLLIPAFIVTVIFSETGVFFAGQRIWIFDETYLWGVFYRQLPLEMYLFYYGFSFSLLAIYSYLNANYPKQNLQKYTLALSNLLLGVMIAILFFAYTKWFTVTTFALLFLLLIYIEYRNKLRYMYRFYRAFLVCLLLFYLSFGLLCQLSIIRFNAEETMDAYLFKIPFEAHFYMMGMLLMGVHFLESINYKKIA